jgi:hypothetical protein
MGELADPSTRRTTLGVDFDQLLRRQLEPTRRASIRSTHSISAGSSR